MGIQEQIKANEEKVLLLLANVGFATVKELAHEIRVEKVIVERIIIRNLGERVTEHDDRFGVMRYRRT